MEASMQAEIQEAIEFIKSKSNNPTIGIICGSGLGGLVDTLTDKREIESCTIPGFSASTVAGHAGKLVFGELSGKSVVCLKGRLHFYEGHEMKKLTFPVRVMLKLGIKRLVVTNTAGGINRAFNVGDIMIIKDHIGLPLLAGNNPLIGKNDDSFGFPRFPSMTSAYDPDLRKMAMDVAKEHNFDAYTRTGVYCMQSGPAYETQAELKMMHVFGADAVGMSTVPEVMVARHESVPVLGISLITNKCIMEYDTTEAPNHEEVLETGKLRSKDVLQIVTDVVARIDTVDTEQ